MIGKILDNTKINKLRLINIYEVNYNLIFKPCLPRKVTHHVDQHNLLGETQSGTRPLFSAENVALIDECVLEISRITCTTLEKLQNDVVTCFDWQVNTHAMLNSRKYEVLDQAYKLLSAILHQTKYHVKTALDILDTSYCSTPEYPFYGTGQGSICAGTI